ncbi:Type I restriction modification DNA specificity domain protein [Candidatus Izimaplasma bacterium HR1]|jgi:type I restriction enzyme S subunit|uniref:restriction endonuclease subunit S n=1 Tax=Candidatus Izimoplasma sp. HR1 TaxID=1541959 RepID=UPI0004F75741|nr:Type I restriction modification DNA specificity domain protein [Candidatus Izimaplasma bacterium HR1]
MRISSEKPSLRFKGYTYHWEKLKLDVIAKITMGQSPSGTNYTRNPEDHILVQGNADMSKGWVVPRVWTTEIIKTANPGDIIMSVRAPAGTVGKTAYKVVLGRGVASIRGNEFVFQSLIRLEEIGFWNKLSTGSTFASINSENLKKTELSVPKNEEQEKIGEIFRNLDNIITSSQQKHNKLTNIKKSLLCKMFPEKDSDIPKIRFKGFNDTWEQTQLGSVITGMYNGQTPATFNKSFWNGELNWLTSGELNRGIVSSTIDKITEAGRIDANLRIVPNGTFIMAITGLEAKGTRGNCGILSIDTTVNQSCMAIYNNPYKLDNNFLFQWYRRNSEEYGLKYTQGTKQQSYNAKIISKLEITLPKETEEQVKVSALLFSLDHLITNYQKEYDILIKVKKALLEKMFV